MAEALGFINIATPEEVSSQERQRIEDQNQTGVDDIVVTELAAHIRRRFHDFRDHRISSGLSERLISALETYNGKYNEQKLQEIKQFGGSEVYARMTTTKCRGATSLLRDVYFSADRFWGFNPTPNPALPESIEESIDQLVQLELQSLEGTPEAAALTPEVIGQRKRQLENAARDAAKKQARKEADKAEDYVDDILTEGRFYQAFVEFLTDLPIFPYACIKGPTLKNSTHIKWVNGKMTTVTEPRMYWKRISPFDIYYTPDASHIDHAEVIEHIRYTRSDLTMMLGVPGYNDEAIRDVLDDYDNGYLESFDTSTDSRRRQEENREQTPRNTSGTIDGLEFHGSVRGEWLIDWGMTADQIEDEDREYSVTGWLIGQHVIKVHINPNPEQRHPYYVTCFERIPGSIAGQSLPEIMGDIQDVANATLRALVNNMSIASGPQVAINEDRLSPSTNGDSLYPWKRWRFIEDDAGSSAPPIDFFQPQSNAQELMYIYKEMSNMADEVSAIPRYLTGGGRAGGAASTASGLSMLMNNSAKILQNVAANIDHDIVDRSLQYLYDMLMLTDESGALRGDEKIKVNGVNMAMAREQDRMRRLEFLQITANPLDQQIVGPKGRAALLRAIGSDLNLPGEDIVIDEDKLEAMLEQQQAQLAAQAQGDQAPGGKQERLGEETDNQQRVVQR